MPKLPTAEQLGTRIPQNRGQVVSGNIDVSGVQQLGRTIESFGETIKDRQDAMNLQKAKTLWQKAKIQADNAFDQDNDFGTYVERYNEMLTKAADEAKELVRNPRMQELLDQDIEISRLQGMEQIKDKAYQKETEAGLATLDEILTVNRENALQATSEADRAAAFDAMNDSIATAELNGYLDADQAQAMRRKNGQEMAVAMVEVQDIKTQKQWLDKGEGPAKIIPSDVRKGMLENVNKRLVIAEGMEEADRIRAVGGSRTERLEEARKIKDPDIRQAVVRQVEHDLQQEKLALSETQYDAYQELAKEVIAGESAAQVITANPQAWDALSAEQQVALQNLDSKQGTDIHVYNELNRLSSENRDRAYGYFLENAHKLSATDAKKWSDRLAKPEELDGYLTRSQRLGMMLNEAGVNKDSEKYYKALEAVDNDVLAFEQRNGKKPNPKEEQEILNSVFDKVIDSAWYNPFTSDKYGFDLSQEKREELRQQGELERFEEVLNQYQRETAREIPLSDYEIDIIYQNAKRMGLLDG